MSTSLEPEFSFGGSGSRDPAEPVASDTCDICGAPRTRSERRRIVWDAGRGVELVLADLCRDCAEQPDRLLEIYGGRDQEALRVTHADAVSARETAPRHRVRGFVLRGLVYILVALAAFVVVTIVASRG